MILTTLPITAWTSVERCHSRRLNRFGFSITVACQMPNCFWFRGIDKESVPDMIFEAIAKIHKGDQIG